MVDEVDYVMESRCLRRETIKVGNNLPKTLFTFNPVHFKGAKLFIGLSGTYNSVTQHAVEKLGFETEKMEVAPMGGVEGEENTWETEEICKSIDA